MNQQCEKDEQFDLIIDEKLSSQEQSTSTQSKQSHANLAMLQDNTKNFKLKRTQSTNKLQFKGSLLQLNHIPPQRRGSQSCIEPIQVIEEECHQIGKPNLYNVFWYDENIDNKYEIIVQATQDILISDFIALVIKEFNLQHDYIHSPFTEDGSLLYELYVPKKKNGKPNEDYPAFADKTQLSKTNLTQFALKVSKLESHYISSFAKQGQHVQESTTKNNDQNTGDEKSFWQKFFFCCNIDI
ncbi:unnamed protein product (macronuclear) [Paramecium tetraurelia]|uniref:Sin1 middle CRIM domain-containing protein n=1 Tax=Paramecium tetraurelia TaxID=5888 RepID=A0E4K8_PARTE|nr:uncharacterized protein GSPATT00023400001 [Paramecium tetraurelia]CAK90225.1 unnamed protein product [Paramecium tetraurelia]|eukprot:XP_001457622.1 hypothetical protein (macronuclear) [Paramecium tetraurelia strain d4-2]